MTRSRREFLKYTGAAGLLIASSDVVAELIAQSPKGNPQTSMFKGLSDVALGEGKKMGCTYADVRFTRSVTSGVNASGGSDRNADGGFGGGRGGRGGAGRGGGGPARWRGRARRWAARRGGIRRSRHPQRRLGIREQPDRQRRRNPPDHPHRRRYR